MPDLTYAQLVDRHGPTRLQAMAAFRLIPQLAGLTDEELHVATFEAWQVIVADFLDQVDCPNCDGVGSLDEVPNEIICPTCNGDGSTYARRITTTTRAALDPALPAKTSTRRKLERPPRPLPLDIDASRTGVLDGQVRRRRR